MLLDSDPADGNLEYWVFDSASLMILSLTLFFVCIPAFKSNTCIVYDFLDTLYGCGNDTQKAKIRVNFTNLAISNFRGF